jgi:hypothetical protein
MDGWMDGLMDEWMDGWMVSCLGDAFIFCLGDAVIFSDRVPVRRAARGVLVRRAEGRPRPPHQHTYKHQHA